MKSILFAAVAAATLLGMPTTVSAATELVTNGDFSTNDFTGWAVYGDQRWNGVYNGVAYFGPYVASPSGITQTVATVPGTKYTLSFDLELLKNVGMKSHNFFEAILNDETIFSFVDVAAPDPFKTYTYNFIATGPTLLHFRFGDDPQFWQFDNVSVQTTVPEAATWAMMIVGVGFAGTALRRRHRVSAKLRPA